MPRRGGGTTGLILSRPLRTCNRLICWNNRSGEIIESARKLLFGAETLRFWKSETGDPLRLVDVILCLQIDGDGGRDVAAQAGPLGYGRVVSELARLHHQPAPRAANADGRKPDRGPCTVDPRWPGSEPAVGAGVGRCGCARLGRSLGSGSNA